MLPAQVLSEIGIDEAERRTYFLCESTRQSKE